MEGEKFFLKKEVLQNPEFQENKEKESKEIYIHETFLEAKDKLREYFPNFYRDISTKLNYQDNAEELKINHHFEGENLNINIKTPENLSDKTVDDIKKQEINFLVFKKVAGSETVSKKIQDFFFLSHEYVHGINYALFKEYRPDMIKLGENRKKELAEVSESRKKEILQEESVNSIISILGESLPISFERIMAEKMLQDRNIDNYTKNNTEKFWKIHEQSLSSRKLEKNPKSKYSELNEAMVFYKIYQKFGEKGIINFAKNFNFDKLSRIKKYSDAENMILSEEYKEFLEMNADEIIKEFAAKET